MGGTRWIKGTTSDGTVEERAMCTSARSGVKVAVGRVVICVGRIPGIGGMVRVGVRSRSGGVGARVIGGWRVRGSNIGHTIRIVIRVRRAGRRGGGRGLSWVGTMLIIGGVWSKRVRIVAIGCIFGVANERLEKGLVPGTHCVQGRGSGSLLGRRMGRKSRTKGANPAEEPGDKGRWR